MNSKGFCHFPAGLAICVMAVALPAAAQNHAHYSRSELRRMMREASSPDQYRTLVTWFREEEAIFRSKAEAENRDYEHYKVRVRTKAPTRADNARNFRDYYVYKADKMAGLASRYETILSRLDPRYQPVAASHGGAATATAGRRLPVR